MIGIQKLHAEMTDCRRHIHAKPEFGFEEKATSEIVAAELWKTRGRFIWLRCDHRLGKLI
ncbi:hypothetical protein ATY79_01670 [Rhizobium sp. R693]|nr:hypothetical protein ATY79_01670 [Rhizobium sp. R693]